MRNLAFCVAHRAERRPLPRSRCSRLGRRKAKTTCSGRLRLSTPSSAKRYCSSNRTRKRLSGSVCGTRRRVGTSYPLLKMRSLSQQLTVGPNGMMMHCLYNRRIDQIPAPQEQMPLPQRIPRQWFDQHALYGTHSGLNGSHSETLGDHRLQLVEHMELVCDRRHETCSPAGFIESPRPPHSVVRRNKPSILGKPLQGNFKTMPKRVAGRGGHEDWNSPDGTMIHLRGVLNRQPRIIAPQAGIHFTGFQKAQEFSGGIHAADGDDEIGKRVAKRVQQYRYYGRIDSAEAKSTCWCRRTRVPKASEIVREYQNFTGLANDLCTVVRKLHTGAAASKHSLAKHPLDTTQLRAHGRLSESECGSRPSDTSQIRYRTQYAQMAQLQLHKDTSIRMNRVLLCANKKEVDPLSRARSAGISYRKTSVMRDPSDPI